MRTIISIIALTALLCALLCGCGGSQTSQTEVTGNGTMNVSINWPAQPEAQDKYIPRATESLVITVANAGGMIANRTEPRPVAGSNSTVTFTSVPAGEVVITITACPNADGTGTLLASATETATIVNRETTTVTLDLDSTITNVTIDQYPTDINATETASLLATARNANGDVVLVLPQPNGFYWKSSNTAVATIDQQGALTAVSEGTVRITAMERESGVTGFVDLTINATTGILEIGILTGQIAVTLTPSYTALEPNGIRQYSATVMGVPNQAVLWSVVEADGGTISANGQYTAPAIAGTYHVRATSVADETKYAEATVYVGERRVYYTRPVDYYSKVWSVKPDGGNGRELPTYPNNALNPAVSLDGTRIAFVSTINSQPDIWVINADGSGLTRVTNDSYNESNPCFSPDAQTIIYVSSYAGKNYIFSIPVTGGMRKTLASATGGGYPRFSPDGTKIVYTTFYDGNFELFTMNAEGSNHTRLTYTPNNNETTPCFNNDGSQIAYSRDHKLYIINSDGSNTRSLSTLPTAYSPSFGPDGKELVCTSYTYSSDQYFIYRVDVETGAATCISHYGEGAKEPFWVY